MTSIFPRRRVRSKLNIDVREFWGAHVFQLTWNTFQGWPMSVLSLQGEVGWGKDYISGHNPPVRPLAGRVGRPVVWDQGVWDGCSSHCSFLNSHQRAQAAWHMYEGPTEEKGWPSWEGRMHENSEQSLWKGKEVETKCCRGSVAIQPPTHLFAAPGSLRGPLTCHHPR